MKKIYINHTKRALVFGKTMLLPGSNVADEIKEAEFPTLAALVEDGDIEVSEDPANAVKSANTQKTVEDIAKMAPDDERVKKAATKRKTALDEIDKQAKESAEKKAKEDSEEDGTGE